MAKLTPEQRQEIADLREQGFPIKEIAQRFGVSRGYISNIHGLLVEDSKVRRKPKEPKYPELDLWMKLNGITQGALGKHIMMAQEQVSNRLYGKAGFTVDDAISIAKLVGMPVERLFKTEGKNEY